MTGLRTPTGRPPRDITDLTASIHELTTAHQHRQSYRAGWTRPNRTGPVIRDHITGQDSLLNQLREAITDRADTRTGAQPGKMAHTSLPRFSADAFDRMQAIREQVSYWCVTLGLDSEGNRRADLIGRYLDQVQLILKSSRVMSYAADAAFDVLRNTAGYIRTAVEVDLLHLLTVAQGLEPAKVADLADDADRWCTWCRIVTGWETPALRPHVPCPHCGTVGGERAGLRVRIDAASGAGGIVDDAGVRAAVCLTCNRTWDADTVGLLAEQLRRQHGVGTEELLDGAA